MRKNRLTLTIAAIVLAGTSFLAWQPTEAQDIKEIAREDILVIAGPSSGQTTFPSPAVANPYLVGADIRTGIKAMFEPLFYYNAFEDREIPWLAEGVRFSDDFKTVTLTLRDGVKWSDGEPFNADDVVFTADLLLENAAGNAELFSATDFAAATENAEKVDDLTVRFNLRNPMPRYARRFLMNYFGNGLFWLPEHIWSLADNPAEFTNYDPEAGWPVTTGPWTLVVSSPTQIFMDRRDGWWAAESGFHAPPQMERIVGIPFVNTDRGAQLIATNAADITMDFPTAALIQNIMRQNPKVTTFSGDANPYGSLDWWESSLYFNMQSDKLPEKAVRRAMDLAIDRERLIAVAYTGASEASRTPFPAYAPLMPYIELSEAAADRHGAAKFDPEGSVALMEAAGYRKDAEGFWARDGQRISYEVQVIPPKRAVGPVVIQLLRNAGFDVSFASSPETPKKLFTGQYDIGIFGHNGSIDSPLETLRLYHCDNAFPLDSGIVSRAIARWCNEAYSALVDEFATFADGDPAALDVFAKAMDLWYAAAMEAPLSQWYHRIPMNQTYWRNFPSAENPYIQPAFWYITGQAGYLFLNLERAGN
ncbi:MAG: ABC transporter substrate-binding protein [Albidovulum sp.]|nr:ABC transporter substrate-binding protein [Albidovulum sp.]